MGHYPLYVPEYATVGENIFVKEAKDVRRKLRHVCANQDGARRKPDEAVPVGARPDRPHEGSESYTSNIVFSKCVVGVGEVVVLIILKENLDRDTANVYGVFKIRFTSPF